MLLILPFFLLQISLVNCDLNITSTTLKIKGILESYNQNLRHKRCSLGSSKIDSFVKNTLKFLDRTQNYGDYVKYLNVSRCVDNHDGEFGDYDYLNEHILNGLLINENVPDSHWLEFKSVHNKSYESSHHEKAALEKWRENLRRVVEHNQNYVAGKHSYSLHLNQFGDLHPSEYFEKVLKLITTPFIHDPAEDKFRTTYRKHVHRFVPKQVDWRSKGFKPRLEEQWQCGACYAFAVTHAVQAQLFRRHQNWRELSPQQIIDCSTKDGNMGCEGGSLRAAMRYVAREGLVMESSYPYRGKQGHCHRNLFASRVKAQRWAVLPNNEKAIERALATIGPLAVAVNAAPFTFQLYRSGIYDDPFCTPWQLNHAMLLVGYSPTYWTLLNWWGKNWGEGGYIRFVGLEEVWKEIRLFILTATLYTTIRRGFNRCGVANMATYVEL